MPRKITISVALDPDQYKLLDQLSQRTKAPKGVYIREGLDHVLEKYKDQLDLFSPASRKEATRQRTRV